MRDKAIDDGGKGSSDGQSIAGETTNRGSYSGWYYHHARVRPLPLLVYDTPIAILMLIG